MYNKAGLFDTPHCIVDYILAPGLSTMPLLCLLGGKKRGGGGGANRLGNRNRALQYISAAGRTAEKRIWSS